MALGRMIKRAAVDGVHSLFTLPPLETALAHFTRGHEVSSLVGRLAPVNTNYQHPAVRQITRDGIRFKLDISDYQDWLVYWGLDTDRPLGLYTLIREGDVVFDVGTNIGDVCMHAAAQVGPQGRVFAFEPDPVSFRKLTDNLSLNRFSNVFAANLGLGDAAATLTMRVNCPTNRGGNRIAHGTPVGEHFSVVVETLDRFVAQRDLGRVDVVKIDVEGFELAVLRGAREVIDRFRPRLFIELFDDNLRGQGTSAAEVVAWLRAADYRVYHAQSGEELDEHQVLPNCDVICRPGRNPTAHG
jgi:FkbM family methyltransferase